MAKKGGATRMRFGALGALMLLAVASQIFVMPLSVHAGPPPPTPLLESQPLISPVTFDGAMTSPTEWSDSAPQDLLLNGPSQISARYWVKNDRYWLYILARVPWPSGDTDPNDIALVAYWWGSSSDLSVVSLNGGTTDAYGFDGSTWYIDVAASPPGLNNVEGKASHDGTYYWFEFRKSLDSGDGYDWALALGGTYGEVPTSLLTGFRDASKGEAYMTPARLHLSSGSVGGVVFSLSEPLMLLTWLGLLGLLGVAAIVLQRHLFVRRGREF